ncbi:MAG: 2-oxoglutarate dehydrogenase complex dihydrolipoyllysine-residue succinyltransferase [Petrimonas sp.]|jgi:2-oxoglutarate dehydrogenase E2 component (dihydrolipoamide succinyltransferase)|uniref:2-oxoglutarate dehydrogenase complex dihydrolipoyllysine-residue succinyltransferase n=1 Tax=Petrimonas TaxID=307628 RepID=UPI000ED8C9D7|nr:2-oxoglutarate dehydrogenase complex dihydrolipoyllysine-residue succinyltransferase [Petrimonas sp.]NLU29137.1 2-oxoglutarate dehydrogenase complex dihydrolipoyllysine-residue succinyltransferase [Bacteroidales bacterium]BBD44893.1 Dihydrolipoamide succinyltransferase component (E2) of 2-oxoglutarate dehydrogenase complex [Petrimonas sp. IBARAKI]HCB88219.1 dihydrolipoyllysine-residue succinyltransferase [Porphyromonadaceae bacterium]MDD2910547.1 2-oxoglutarate dehydrogenase complex dihydrol
MAIIEIRVPSPGESITHVELYKWLVADGAVVKKDTEIAELESEKATLTLVADESGKISLKASEGDSLEVGSVACTIDTSVQPEADVETEEKKQTTAPADTEKKEIKPEPAKTESRKPEAKATTDDYGNVKVTPLAKRVMEENDLSLEDVISGLRRLKRSDVEAVLAASGVSSVSGLKKPASRESRIDRMSSLRRKLSERLVSVKNETAMLTTFNEVNMKPIMDLRKNYQDRFVEKHGIKLGMMSFFLKACSIALQEFPSVNSMMEGENMTTYDYADISVAVSTPKGLMVPVIRNVESMGLSEIEKAIAEVADKARKGKLSIPEMTGGTFTITNGGVFGSMMSTPIINPPQSAILGMHNILDRPVVVEGQIVVRPMMYVALSYDHRVIDGRESVGFLVRVKQLLENPTDMLFGKSSGEKELLEL